MHIMRLNRSVTLGVLTAVWALCTTLQSADFQSGVDPGAMVSNGLGNSEDPAVVTIDPPGAIQGRALGMNEAGDVVGLYRDESGTMHGFLREQDGTYSTIDVPGATFTIAHGINNPGDIVGRFGESATGRVRGFLLTDGTFTFFDFPGSRHIEPEDINERGVISGKYRDTGGVQHGFTLYGGSFSTIDVPGADSTDAQSVCNSGAVIGDLGYPTDTIVRSFTMKDSVFDVFALPGASATAARFMSEAGVIVGIVIDEAGQHGFRLDRSGNYGTIDVPGATQTSIFAGNDENDVAGSFVAGGIEHAFLAPKWRGRR
jgi:hypothetical protein